MICELAEAGGRRSEELLQRQDQTNEHLAAFFGAPESSQALLLKAATLRAKGVQRAKEERKQEKEERARQLREAKFACLREEGDVLIDSVVVKGGRCEGILAGLKLDAVFEMEGLRVRLVEMVGTCGQLQLVDNPTKPLLRRLQAWLQKYLQMLVDVWTKVADEEPVLYASVQVEELSFRDLQQ